MERPRKKDTPQKAYVEEDDSDSPQPPARLADVEGDDSDSHGPHSRIEEGIKARNAKAYKNLRQAAMTQEHPTEEQDWTNTTAKPISDENTDAKKPVVAKGILTTVPVSQLGIKVMNPETTETSVDIIAVHGLGAIPEITWKEKHSGVNWLADARMLPKAVPDARIMRFGYDSLWLGKHAIKTKLSTIANKLLLGLNREREVS
jgi:hypothetical protein